MRYLSELLFLGLAVLHPAFSADGLTLQQRTAARKVYVAKCAKCHRFYEPNDYTNAEWQVWMEKMNKKAKLKPDQATLLTRYLETYRAGKLGGKPEAVPAGARNQR